MEDDHYSDDADVSCALGDEVFIAGDDAEEEALAAVKPQDESLLLRRRRVEKLMDAKRLSKQLFDFDELDVADHSFYDDDLFEEIADQPLQN